MDVFLFFFNLIIASCSAFTAFSISAQSTRYKSQLFYRNATDMNEVVTKRRPDFKQRMRNIVNQQQRKAWRPDNMKTVLTLHEYADVIEEGRGTGRVVVVNFHATWCKKCHSLRPAFNKMAAANPSIIYLDVPITESNSNLHKGLVIETVPFCHIYHPEQGLVKETKISRETLSDFVSLVKKYC